MISRSFLLLIALAVGVAQSQPGDAPLTFEVASIKPASPDARDSGFYFIPGGGLRMTNVSPREMMAFAYDVRGFQISGGPGWFGDVRYDVLGKPEGAQGPADLTGVSDKQRSVIQEQIKKRLQALLAERFQLTIHRETKEFPVYVLVVAKNGPKLNESKEGDGSPPGLDHNSTSAGKHDLTATRISMQMLGDVLSGTLDRPVQDQTGLKVNYDLKLEWTQDQSAQGALGGRLEPSLSESFGPSLFTAIQQQLGLKLESQKGPVEIIVIDRVEKASEN